MRNRRRWKRVLIGAFAGCAVLADAGAAAAQAAASTEQLAISTPPAGSAAWVQDHSFDRTLPDPATTTPAAAAAFFASLAPTELDRLIRDYPLVVGNFDGAPLDLRYRANKIALAAERDSAWPAAPTTSSTPTPASWPSPAPTTSSTCSAPTGRSSPSTRAAAA